MARNYSNIAVDTTLTAGINAAVGSCVVASATGWPAAPFAAVIDPGLVTEEVVQVTVKVGTTFTITRGFDGTAAAAHALGAVVRHAAIAGDFTDLQTADTAEAGTRASADSALSSAISAEATTRGNADTALSSAISSEASTRAAADALLTPMARTLTVNGVTFDLSANRSWTVSGGVSSVTASSPLASSGGATPDISLTGIVPAANGGTGVNNAGTLTNATNTTITGGGTLALGGFTLTVPAAGSAALLGTANVFTAAQTINGANLGIAITGAASGGTPSIVASSPAVAASTAVGTPLQITASPAIAGSTNAGAAVGGDVTITAGAAARLTSGNANGGNINLTPGAGIGTGTAGQVRLGGDGTAAVPALAFASETALGFYRPFSNYIGIPLGANPIMLFGTAGSQLGLPSGGTITWTASTTTASGASDTAVRRDSAGVVQISNGTAGQWGALKAGTRDAGTTTITDGLTLGHQSTGTPAAGLGTAIKLNINDSTTPDVSALRLTSELVVATHASYTTRGKWQQYDFNGAREVLRGEADGTNPMIGFLGAAATARVAVTGSRAGNAALASLLTELASKGLITDSSSA